MLNPPSDEFSALLEQAQALEVAGETTNAESLYRRAAALRPGHALPFTRLSLAAARRAWGRPPPARAAAPDGVARVSVSTLGEAGRFANQLLQYVYLKLYAGGCQCPAEVPDWIGRDLFGLDDPLVSRRLPQLAEEQFDAAGALAPGARPRSNVDLWGYFAFPSAAYAPHRAQIREMLRFRGPAAAQLEAGWRASGAAARDVVAIHLRRGDYGYGRFWIAPAHWYHEWLEQAWPRLRDPLLYIATDDPSVIGEFAGYRPIGAAAFGPWPAGLEYVADFYALTRARELAIANSSFSFVAALLNAGAAGFFRPDPLLKELRAFDPWDAPVFLDLPSAPATSAQDAAIIRTFIPAGATVLDVGAGQGGWSRMVHDYWLGNVHLHLFAAEGADVGRLEDWAGLMAPGSACIAPTGPIGQPEEYCRANGIQRVHFLRIGRGAVTLMRSCETFLDSVAIDCVQLDHTAPIETVAVAAVIRQLRARGMRVLRVDSSSSTLSEWSGDSAPPLATYVAARAR